MCAIVRTKGGVKCEGKMYWVLGNTDKEESEFCSSARRYAPGTAEVAARSRSSFQDLKQFTMPVQLSMESTENEIRVKTAYNGELMVTYIKPETTLEQLYEEIKNICRFSEEQDFTVKWVDEDGDPCTISSQIELDEAFRLYDVNKDSELLIHVFASVPQRPGMLCPGEDKSIYRRGARRWRKLYRTPCSCCNSHYSCKADETLEVLVKCSVALSKPAISQDGAH
ncbi:Protein kinase C iota type [Blattella germanica]|nr:Protein kinase C iota type [Blattella germanica]